MKYIKRIFIPVVLIATILSFSSFSSHFELAKNLEIFVSVFKKLNQEYVDDIDAGELMQVGIDAMLESLDPYTVFYSESEIEDYKASISGEYGGIGSMIRTDSNYVVITEPYENSPAQKSGLLAGDKIITVDGKSVEGKNAGDLSKLLKGTPGTEVKIEIERPYGEKKRLFTIKREKIKLKSVPHYEIMEDSIAYIKLTKFTSNCGKEVTKAYTELATKADIKGIVLDLRGNPGGLLREAINVSNAFIPKGQLVVYTKGREEDSKKIYNTLNEPSNLEAKLVVLIDGHSASASEIVSGTIQDLDRGVIVGGRSYGKGLVQTTKPLVYNSQVKLTTAKYYIPSGRCIQELDYSKKDAKGKATAMADSLRTQFKTKGGRIVFDGRGVHPDAMAKDSSFSNIAIALMRNNLIFDFATLYQSKHAEIPQPYDFKITDKDFEEFSAFIEGKDYSYSTQTEKALDKLESKTKKESYYDALEKEIQSLKDKLEADKANDLTKFKDEIKFLLRQELITRYYYQKGKIMASFERDNYLKEAIHLIQNEEDYQALFQVESIGDE